MWNIPLPCPLPPIACLVRHGKPLWSTDPWLTHLGYFSLNSWYFAYPLCNGVPLASGVNYSKHFTENQALFHSLGCDLPLFNCIFKEVKFGPMRHVGVSHNENFREMSCTACGILNSCCIWVFHLVAQLLGTSNLCKNCYLKKCGYPWRANWKAWK